jgi:nicotinate-nucleotide--dimethylbenzimidazole phosphoribosyltransferase
MSFELQELVRSITPPRAADPLAVQEHIDDLTKPPGSLGTLEQLALRLALIYGDPPPPLVRRRVFVFAGDHGVARSGVSAYPAEVTAQMCHVLGAQHAAVNALARAANAHVHAFDVGVDCAAAVPGIERQLVRRGTRDFASEPALTRAEVLHAIQVGFVRTCGWLDQADMVGLGELGIGNSTAAAAITAALTGAPVDRVVGRGTGIDDARLILKREIIARALDRIPASADGITVLEHVGGLELSALVGCIFAAAQASRAIVLDGFIATSAALLAAAICPAVQSYFFASHLSVEPGHRVQLNALGLEPLFDFNMRLGEGTGAVLAFPILDGAAGLLREMATFSGAGVARALEAAP